jgi:hypothetical protein
MRHVDDRTRMLFVRATTLASWFAATLAVQSCDQKGTASSPSSGVSPDGSALSSEGGEAGGGGPTEAAVPEAGGDAAESEGGDAGGEAGTACAACAGVLCEDFETGEIDPTKWSTKLHGGATVTVQQQIVAHGKYAAQFHSPDPQTGAPQDYAYIIASMLGAGVSVSNYGRAYFYTDPKPTSVDTGLIFGGTAGFPSPNYMSIASSNSGWQFGYIQLMSSPQGEVQNYPAAQMPVGTWLCLEWQFNDQPDTINVWGNGQLIGTLDNSDVDYPSGHAAGTPLYNSMNSGLIGSFVDFGFGFYDWHPGTVGFNVYYDDIVIGTQRVGCL